VTFLVIAVLTLLAAVGATVAVSGHIARQNALDEAESTVVRMDTYVVGPVLQEAYAGKPGRWEELDRRVADRLRDQSLKAVFVWSTSGQVLYSSDASLVGRTVPMTDELSEALHGTVTSEVEPHPEVPFAGMGDRPLLEVYAPMTLAGRPAAIETYFSSTSLDHQAGLLRLQILPLAVGALLLLQLVQTPITVSLVRRLHRQQADYADLLARSLTASERERRAIAADVHDGPVQELAGISYGLDALRTTVPAASHSAIDRMVTAVRETVWSLRRLIVDLYPPDLSPQGLTTALDDMAEQARRQGVEVEVEVDPTLALTPELAAVVYRTTKEALVNVVKHAGATQAWIRVHGMRGAESEAVVLAILDDGRGFSDSALTHRVDGHLGLRLMSDRVAEAGGVLTVATRPEGGAAVSAVLPLGGVG
jgi:signal transduction histidine kinase